jgi:hypothetical protein
MHMQREIQGSFAALRMTTLNGEVAQAKNRRQQRRRTDNSNSEEQARADHNGMATKETNNSNDPASCQLGLAWIGWRWFGFGLGFGWSKS